MTDLVPRPWVSANEIIPTAEDLTFVESLHEKDFQIAKPLILEFPGFPKRSLVYRGWRRVNTEFKNYIKVISSKPGRFVSRWIFNVQNRKTHFPIGSEFRISGQLFEIVELENGKLREKLEKSKADYWILVRQNSFFASKSLDFLSMLVLTSNASVWFGDSRNHKGKVHNRGEFTKLLLRQVDFLGPVIVVRIDKLRTIPQEIVEPLWPLYLGLVLPEREVELVPQVIGIGEEVESDLQGFDDLANQIVEQELQRNKLRAIVESAPMGRRRVTYLSDAQPLVSIIIPTRGTASSSISSFIGEAVSSVIEKTKYSNFEIVIVADDETPQSVIDQVDAISEGKVRWTRWVQKFNFSEKMNLGVAVAEGDLLLFLNDDVEVVSPEWLNQMCSLIGVDSIGYVGALLFFDDQTIQHAGHFYKGGAGHIGLGEPLLLNNSDQIYVLDRITSGVTAACSLISKQLFNEIGGFSPSFPGNYNDVDLSLKVRQTGAKIAVSGNARLYHFESKTRDASVKRTEIIALHERWSSDIQSDRYERGH